MALEKKGQTSSWVLSVMSMWTGLQPDYAVNMWNKVLNMRLGTEVGTVYIQFRLERKNMLQGQFIQQERSSVLEIGPHGIELAFLKKHQLWVAVRRKEKQRR